MKLTITLDGPMLQAMQDTSLFTTLPDITDLKAIFDPMLGPVRMAVLDAALEMDIAAVLQQAGDPKDMAGPLGIRGELDNLRRFLDALTAMGFAQKRDGRYANTLMGETFLLPASPSYMGELFANLKRMQHRNLDRIPELVRQGPPPVSKEDRIDTEDRWRRSARHLSGYQKGGVAEYVASVIARLPEFPDFSRMLDLGGGPGIMCMATVARHPHLVGVVCDHPAVLEVAREEIEAAGLADRMRTIAGDYNTVDLGSGYDLIWASQTLYFAKDLDMMMERVLEALNPGGVFMSMHEGLSGERTWPEPVVLSRLSLALVGQDTCFEHGRIARSLERAGFASVRIGPMELGLGEQELITARKAA